MIIENFYKGNKESDTQMWEMLFPPGKREWKEMGSGALEPFFFAAIAVKCRLVIETRGKPGRFYPFAVCVIGGDKGIDGLGARKGTRKGGFEAAFSCVEEWGCEIKRFYCFFGNAWLCHTRCYPCECILVDRVRVHWISCNVKNGKR